MKKIEYTAAMFFVLFVPVLLLMSGAVTSSASSGSPLPSQIDQKNNEVVRLTRADIVPISQPLSIFSLARRERVAWVNIGDSNMIFGGYGWDHGISKALQRSFGLWSTGVQPINGDGKWGNAGYISKQLFGTIATTGAPAQLTDRLTNTPATIPYAYLANGTAQQVGMIYTGGNEDRHLRYHYTYATDSSWNGSFRPAIRLGTPPYTDLATTPVAKSTQGTAGAYVDAFIDLPAGSATRGQVLNARLHTNSDSVNAQFFGTVQSIEDVAATAGFSSQVLSFYPSKSTRDTLVELENFGTTALAEYFRQVRRHLGPSKAVVVGINEGLNDRNDHNPSRGPIGGLDSATPEGFKDNTRGIIALIRSVYAAQNWDQDQLFFVLYPSHPVSTPDDNTLVQYRQALRELSREERNIVTVSIDSLITADEMLTRGYYQSGGADRYHLTQPAYEEIASRIVASLLPTIFVPPQEQ